jgi:molecular chaperone DnaJ
MMFGIEGLERLCPTCRGNSYTIKNPCRKCRGTGTVQTSEHAQVSVPAGIEEGMEIRVHGAGNYSRGHGTGDLVATASLRIHPVFRKNGLDLSCEIVVGTAEARQGSSVEVPGLGSGFRLQIPPNTRPGQTFRIKGGGLPGTAGERGDLHVRITTG